MFISSLSHLIHGQQSAGTHVETLQSRFASPWREKGIGFIAGAVNEIDAENNKLVMDSGDSVDYDYLIITTGPRLAFEEVEGVGPHDGHTHSVCSIDHAEMFYEKYQEFDKDPGHVIFGALPFASCFGPTYEFA